MRAGSLLLALAVILPLTALGARPAYACSCAMAGSVEEAFRSSDAVFSGEVLEIGSPTPEQDGVATRVRPYLAPVTFDVQDAWKGVSGESAVVYGQGPGASCGLDFERGETYLVFAYGAETGKESPLQTSFCSATRQASVETARNMFGLPAGTLPETGGVPSEDAGRDAGSVRVVVPIALAVLATGVFVTLRVMHGPTR